MATPINYSNLVAWYTFESGDGSDLTAGDSNSGDSTDYSLTINGATHSNTGGVYDINDGSDSGVFSFDGSDDYLGSAKDPGSTFTVCGWVYLNSASEDNRIFDSLDNNKNGMSIVHRGDDNIGFRSVIGDGSSFNTVVKGSDENINQWHFVATTYDGSTNILYIDGEKIGSQNVNYSASGTANIGRSPGFGRYHNGKIDDVRVYNTALSESQINSIYNNTNPYGETILENFSDGSLSAEFTVNDSDFTIKSNRAYDNSTYSVGIEDGSNVTQADVANYIPDELSGGKQPDSISWYWNEDNQSYGGGIRLLNSSGNTIGGFVTDNPQWYVQNGDGTFSQIYDGGGNYDDWVYFEMSFDYTNDEITYYGENQRTGATASVTKSSVNTLSDIEQIDFVDFASDVGYGATTGSGSNNNIYMWFDAIKATNIQSLDTINISLTDTDIDVGDTTTATVTASYDDGSTETVTSESSIFSNDTNIATVSGSTVTPQGFGSTTIQADYNGETDTAPLDVVRDVILTALNVANVTDTQAELIGEVTEINDSNITNVEIGFDYRKSGSSVWNTIKTDTVSVSNITIPYEYSDFAENINEGTQYEFRAYAIDTS